LTGAHTRPVSSGYGAILARAVTRPGASYATRVTGAVPPPTGPSVHTRTRARARAGSCGGGGGEKKKKERGGTQQEVDENTTASETLLGPLLFA
jgi:hypothetical protein